VPQDCRIEVRYAAAAPGVFTQRRQYVEMQRLGSPQLLAAEAGKQCLSLQVPYPLVGLVYLLKWSPPVAPRWEQHGVEAPPAPSGAEETGARTPDGGQDRSAIGPSARLELELRRLMARYETLSRRIAALDGDISQVAFGVDRQKLEEQQESFKAARTQVAEEMAAIEAQLGRESRMT
jgi:hypothetical protein